MATATIRPARAARDIGPRSSRAAKPTEVSQTTKAPPTAMAPVAMPMARFSVTAAMTNSAATGP